MAIRLDKLLAMRGLVKSRSHGAEIIKAGQVSLPGFVIIREKIKASLKLPKDISIEISPEIFPNQVFPNRNWPERNCSERNWLASRAGVKLKYGLEYFNIKVADQICLDVGAGAGGFTDILLRFGAKKVIALDVGSGQIEAKLREDQRVTTLENTDIRIFDLENVGLAKGELDFLCCDVSFISLQILLPYLYDLQPKNMVLLVKPQFEVGRNGHKNGYVKPEKAKEVIAKMAKIIQQISQGNLPEYILQGTVKSPILGRKKGNIEYIYSMQNNLKYLLYLDKLEPERIICYK